MVNVRAMNKIKMRRGICKSTQDTIKSDTVYTIRTYNQRKKHIKSSAPKQIVVNY